jgi:AraC family transcriptional regulator
MLYFTSLPNHNDKRFNEQSHFAKFKEHNIVFNAITTKSFCEKHVGCLSIKTVWSGMEAYEFQGVQRNVTPGQFLILNNEQPYSSRIDSSENVQSLSVFFTNEFSASVFHDARSHEETLLDNFDHHTTDIPDFFQALYSTDPVLQTMLRNLSTETMSIGEIDEQLIFVLRHLLTIHRSEVSRSQNVEAVKALTRKEIYRRLCVARDVLHSSYMNDLDLSTISREASLSVPQLVRQFKATFNATPHHYLRTIRLERAAVQLKTTREPVQNIALNNGFENFSAFCRAFRKEFGLTPLMLRRK